MYTLYKRRSIVSIQLANFSEIFQHLTVAKMKEEKRSVFTFSRVFPVGVFK